MTRSLKLNVLALKAVAGIAGQRTIFTIEGMPGLRLYLEPSGTRTWYFEYKCNKQKKKVRLGNAEYLSLQDVREKALALRRDVELGHDPRAVQIVEKRKDEEQAFTLSILVGRWLEANDHLRTIGNRRRVLEASVLPILGHRVVQDITRRDVIALVDKVASRGAKAAADQVAMFLSSVFNWGCDEDLCATNPATRIRKRAHLVPRERVLSDDELYRISVFLRSDAVDGRAITDVTRKALLFVLLTGQRRGEVIGTDVSEIDTRRQAWVLPAERTKNNRRHDLPLITSALALAKDLLAIAGESRFLFPAATKYAACPHLHHRSLSKALERVCSRFNLEGISTHCFRRTMATRLGEAGISGEVI
jgi:integrase